VKIKVPDDMPEFKSDPGGELALCRSCYSKGYDEDAYHPITVDYWPARLGRPQIFRCLACHSEMKNRKRGSVDSRRPSGSIDTREAVHRGEVPFYVVMGRGDSVDLSASEAFA
jgi:hypothetical protein